MFKISVALAILLFFQAVTSSPIEKRQGDQKLQVDKFDNTNLLDNASDSRKNFLFLDTEWQAGKLKVDAIESPDLLDDTPDCRKALLLDVLVTSNDTNQALAADDTTLLKRQAAGKLKVDAVENPDLEDTTPGCCKILLSRPAPAISHRALEALDQGPVTDSSDEPSVATGISRPTSGIVISNGKR
ncbi:hypothetical protein CVT25_013463 [Psilocybe cyanescens]|uniref:Uncharacterized protein n=1 Tax=Psilocybe cyanescens TaxID=93625 RepID=A0A409WTL4_PSICY|nr:hypothetical protein CVT25_013463 [Psilocybe cyanescens]